jgi:hypothetical protein
VGARYIKNLLGGLEQASKAYQPFDRYRHDVSGVKVMTAPGIGQKIGTRKLSRGNEYNLSTRMGENDSCNIKRRK